MADMIISSGLPDSALYLQAAANVAAPFESDNNSGNFPLVGNVLANRKLASRWLMINLSSRAFVDGMGVTSVGAESENVGFLRFPLLYMPPRLKRTLGVQYSAGDTSHGGTIGNSEPFNKNLPHGVATDGYDMKFVQEYDEAVQISKVNMRMIGANLDLLGQYTSYIPIAVGLLMDADVMATHIGAGLANAYANGNANVVVYNSANNSTDGYLQGVMNTLASKLSNVRGKYKEGIISYPKDKSVFVLRWSIFNELMKIKNGAIINSDIGQKILLNGYMDDTGTKLLGNYIEGKYNGIYIKVIPDEYWDTAAAELNLTTSQYEQFNKVVGYIANGEGTLFGMSANVTDIDKAPTTSIGFIVRNDWGWGVKNVRPSSIALLVASSNNLVDFTNPVQSFTDIVSPANVEELITAYQEGTVSELAIQRIGVVNPNYACTVTLTVQDDAGTPAAVTGAEVLIRKPDGYVEAVNNGDGTYTFTVERGVAVTALISATGFDNESVDITTSNTAGATYSKTVGLTTANP